MIGLMCSRPSSARNLANLSLLGREVGAGEGALLDHSSSYWYLGDVGLAGVYAIRLLLEGPAVSLSLSFSVGYLALVDRLRVWIYTCEFDVS